jgi:GT2 family glycosyltransferase
MKPSVCAVVVTYNRKALLRECLQALLGQSRPLDAILVVNNLSTDGTEVMLAEEFPSLSVMNMTENLGGAGGFHEGMRRAHELGHDWIWIMDDDAEPRPETLERLLGAADELARQADPATVPVALCPIIHGVNTGGIQSWHHKTVDGSFREFFLDEKTELPRLLPIDGDAFVGPMFNRAGIASLGLPRKEYFLWVDDLEYTYRYSQQGHCYLVTDAVILHKDKPTEIAPVKRYYQQRNYTDFILRRGPAYCRDRQGLAWRRAKGLGHRLWVTLRVSKGFLKDALKGRNGMRLGDSMLPMLGLWHGITGRSGKY